MLPPPQGLLALRRGVGEVDSLLQQIDATGELLDLDVEITTETIGILALTALPFARHGGNPLLVCRQLGQARRRLASGGLRPYDIPSIDAVVHDPGDFPRRRNLLSDLQIEILDRPGDRRGHDVEPGRHHRVAIKQRVDRVVGERADERDRRQHRDANGRPRAAAGKARHQRLRGRPPELERNDGRCFLIAAGVLQKARRDQLQQVNAEARVLDKGGEDGAARETYQGAIGSRDRGGRAPADFEKRANSPRKLPGPISCWSSGRKSVPSTT